MRLGSPSSTMGIARSHPSHRILCSGAPTLLVHYHKWLNVETSHGARTSSALSMLGRSALAKISSSRYVLKSSVVICWSDARWATHNPVFVVSAAGETAQEVAALRLISV